MIKLFGRLRHFMICSFICCLTACGTNHTYAPVVDIPTIQPIPTSGQYKVVRGDTIYQIAWRYGLDYSDLARRNRIRSPYEIHIGEVIYLRGWRALPKLPKPVKKVAPKRQPKLATKPKMQQRKPVMAKQWAWPAKGNIVRRYGGMNKGINIAGRFASPVRAANGGIVVYSGNGLRHYGNLIIIKHNRSFMSAYAHNRVNTVKEGDVVRRGQKIAEMGSSGTNKVMLHFEIRRNGKPINPINTLK